MFLHRTEELTVTRNLMSELLAGKPIEKPIRYFYGAPMIGKSSLLREIRGCAVEEFGIPNALIDFDPVNKEDSSSTKDLYKGALALFNLIDDMKQQLTISPLSISDHDDEEKAAKKFLDDVRNSQKLMHKPLLLLFDTLEEVDTQVFDKLQNNILIPLLESRDTLIVIAARAHIRELPVLFDWSLRRQLRTHQLRPFTIAETESHFKKLLSEETDTPVKNPQELFKYTNGIPGLNEFVVYNKDKGKVLNKVIENAILERVPKAKKLIDILSVVSVLRLFDTELLAYLVRSLEIEVGEDLDQNFGTKLLIELLETTLVEHRADGTGYVVVEDIRRILYEYLRETNPKRVIRVHELSVQWFDGEVVKGDAVLIVDLIYHQAGVWFNQQIKHGEQSGEIDQVESRMRDRFHQLLSIFEKKLEVLRGDPRESMLVKRIKGQFFGSEFEWFLTKNEIDSIASVCDSFQKENSYSLTR